MYGTRTAIKATFVLFGAMAATGTARAEADALLCGLTHAASCAPRGECVAGPPETVNLPVLLRVGLKDRTVQAQRQGAEARTSAVSSVIADGPIRVLQGAEFGMGWTLVIDTSTGSATITASRAQEGFVAFGTCTSELLK